MKYQISKGSKAFGASVIFRNIQFEIRNNEKIAVVGRNGCGKTTLLRIIAGEESLDSGDIHIENGVRIGYLAQTTFMDEGQSVQQELEHAFDHLKALEQRLNEAAIAMADDPSEKNLNLYAALQEQYEAGGGYSWESELRSVFTRFGFHESDLQRQGERVQRRAEDPPRLCEAAALSAGHPASG